MESAIPRYAEEYELGFGVLGKDNLYESALMRLCANTVAHRLVRDKGHSFSTVKGANGAAIDLVEYWSHLSVPEATSLGRISLWDRLSIDVDVGTFRWLALEAHCRAQRKQPDPAPAIGFKMGLVFRPKDAASSHVGTVPDVDQLAAVRELAAPPSSGMRLAEIRREGGVLRGLPKRPLQPKAAITYRIAAGRDLPAGYGRYGNVDCSSFPPIMDYAEQALVEQHVGHRLPAHVLMGRDVLEREIYLLELCRAGDLLEIDVQAGFVATETQAPTDGLLSVATLVSSMDLYVRQRLVAAAHVKKRFWVPEQDEQAQATMSAIVADFRMTS